MALPGSIFPQGRELIPSLNYVDIASATGYVAFSGVGDINSVGTLAYHLIEDSIAANTITHDDRPQSLGGTPYVRISATNGTKWDLDFDSSLFQAPRTINGKVIVSFTLSSDAVNVVSGIYSTITLYKWDGVSETSLGSYVTVTRTLAANTTYGYVAHIDVVNQLIKPGEQIRINIITIGTDNDDVGLWHMPDNLATTDNTLVAPAITGASKFGVAIPFKLDFI